VNVRGGPGTSYPIVRVLSKGTQVAVLCQTPGPLCDQAPLSPRGARARPGAIIDA
jgi:uncharacterized protein YraI